MTTAKTYWRLHWDGTETFSAENANSRLWGSVDDGKRGYSCCESADKLVEYFSHDDVMDPEDPEVATLPVVEFEGDEVGTGADGEPLVVPSRVIRWTTYGEVWAS